MFTDLQHGAVDRALLSDNGNAYFNAQAPLDAKVSLAPLGTPRSLQQTLEHDRGGSNPRDPALGRPARPPAAAMNASNGLGLGVAVIDWDAAVDWSQYALAVLRSAWDYSARLQNSSAGSIAPRMQRA